MVYGIPNFKLDKRVVERRRKQYEESGIAFHLGAAIGMGYVPCKGEGAAALLASSYEIEIAGRRVTAEASLKPLYDAEGARVRM